MPVFYQGRPAQVWRVDPNAPYPDWVAMGFMPLPILVIILT